jgi:hypothetical protein
MKRKRRRLSKKKLQQLDREEAEKESKARRESEERRENIKVRWQELKQAGPNRLKDLAAENDLGAILVDLVGLQKAEIEHMRPFHQLCEWAETHAREKLDTIESAHFRDFAEGISRSYPYPKLTPKQRGERERQRYNWRGVGLIEYEFGGKGETEWRKSSLSCAVGEPYKPTCLDDILRGGFGEVKMVPGFAGGPPIAIDTRSDMQRLQELFGMHRNRFPKNLPHRRTGREILYDWRAVEKIMKASLSKRPKRETLVRGAPQRVWLSDPDLRNRVLSGIEARISSICVSKKIAGKFMAVIQPYLHNTAKK